MAEKINRRDFLKLASTFSLSFATPRSLKTLYTNPASQYQPRNVIVIVFDAFSANNISLYGYPRKTTPNIDRLSQHAIVYHNHYAGGNFTTSGTASLLTGTLPWKHRALQLGGQVGEGFANKSIFNVFSNYNSISYTHNAWAYKILKQFNKKIDELIPIQQLKITNTLRKSSILNLKDDLFQNDQDLADVSWYLQTNINNSGYSYSLFGSRLAGYFQKQRKEDMENLLGQFPLGLPSPMSEDIDGSFLIEDALEFFLRKFKTIDMPFVSYLHLLPPHQPYRPSKEFYNTFEGDNYKAIEKPVDIFGKVDQIDLWKSRREYDEFILYCDQQFGKFYESLEKLGMLENTWLVLTSDHGELNERGLSGHHTDSLYQPNIRIPLMIFEPGRKTGEDIYENTSAADVLPTLAFINNQTVPSWTEGVIMPPFNQLNNIAQRNVFAVRAVHNSQYSELTRASTTLIKEHYKLHYYFGFGDVFEKPFLKLFDLKNDPEEMTDIALLKQSVTSELLNELKAKLQEINKFYQ